MGGVYRIQTFFDFYILFMFTKPLSQRLPSELSYRVLINFGNNLDKN